MTDFLPVTLTPSLRRRQYSREFKRQIVEASLVPGASIAAVALTHRINANLLHKWRWRYLHGAYGAVVEPPALAAVHIVEPAMLAAAKPSQPTTISTNTRHTGHIELFFNDMRVLVHGAPDSQTLRNIIETIRT